METTCEPNIPKRFTLTAGSEDTLKPSTSCMMGLDYMRPLATPRDCFGKILGLQIFTPQLVGK